jgi:hypothetical protein
MLMRGNVGPTRCPRCRKTVLVTYEADEIAPARYTRPLPYTDGCPHCLASLTVPVPASFEGDFPYGVRFEKLPY